MGSRLVLCCMFDLGQWSCVFLVFVLPFCSFDFTIGPYQAADFVLHWIEFLDYANKLFSSRLHTDTDSLHHTQSSYMWTGTFGNNEASYVCLKCSPQIYLCLAKCKETGLTNLRTASNSMTTYFSGVPTWLSKMNSFIYRCTHIPYILV